MGVPSRRPLFRQEVIEFQQQNRQWGRVVPLQPLPARLMVWFVAACTMAVVLFLGGVQMMMLGVIGEYLGRVFNETKGRPLYFVERHIPSRAADRQVAQRDAA